MMPTCELQVVPLKHHSAPNSPLKEPLFALACTLYMYLNFIAIYFLQLIIGRRLINVIKMNFLFLALLSLI